MCASSSSLTIIEIMQDIAFGYQFVNALYQGRTDRALKVDLTMM